MSFITYTENCACWPTNNLSSEEVRERREYSSLTFFIIDLFLQVKYRRENQPFTIVLWFHWGELPSSKLWEIFQISFLIEHLQTTAYDNNWNQPSSMYVLIISSYFFKKGHPGVYFKNAILKKFTKANGGT